ncbi:MAG: hypothetical protein HRU38_10995 [Saccharospirillaceae bacterium]|nr:hypothetical protein [Saccharospirillaceae bacterium]
MATIYLMLSSSFQSFNCCYDSSEFNIWKLSFIEYPPEAIISVAKLIPKLRKVNGDPYDFVPSLPVINDLLTKQTMIFLQYPDLEKAYTRIFKFKRKNAAEREATNDHFVYTLYKILNQKMGGDAEIFKRIFKLEYIKLSDGLISGDRILDHIPKAIENKK